MYSRCKFLMRYDICKCFHLYGLYFSFLDGDIWSTELFNFGKVHFIYLFIILWSCELLVSYLRVCPIQDHKDSWVIGLFSKASFKRPRNLPSIMKILRFPSNAYICTFWNDSTFSYFIFYCGGVHQIGSLMLNQTFNLGIYPVCSWHSIFLHIMLYLIW